MLINKISDIRWTKSYNDTQSNYRVVIKGFTILILKYATSELCCYDCFPFMCVNQTVIVILIKPMHRYGTEIKQ